MPGVRRRILSLDKNAMLVLYKMKRRNILAKHSHANTQHGLVIKGGDTFEFSNDKKYEIGENEAYYVPPNEEHMLRTGSAEENIFLDVFAPPREDFRAEARIADVDS